MSVRRIAAGLAIVVAAVLSAPPAGAVTLFLHRPDIHGDQVVFTSEGDLWLGSIAGHSALRITSDEGEEGPAFFSPDGATLAFTAQYDGGTDIYVMDLANGGAPRRLTWDPTGATAVGWTPDGREVLFRSARNSGTRRNRLWAVPAAGGPARLLPLPQVEFAAMNPDGHRLAYVPVSAEWQHWKRYRGGQADDVWLADLADHSFRRLTTDPGVDTQPVWVGEAIYFVSERDGHANLWRLDPAGGEVAQATRYADYDVRYAASDGRRVVFEHGDGLGLFDPATGRAEELDFDLHSDRVHARERRVAALDNLFGVELGPTGKRLLVSARGQVLSAPAEHGDVRVAVAQAGARCQYPAWSPDGRTVAFVSDLSGEEQVWLVGADGGTPRQLTKDHQGPLGALAWSPDGRWIATSDREMRVLLVDARSGAMTLVDQADRGGSYDESNTSYRFSPDSKWLAFARIEPNWNRAVYLYDIAGRRKVAVTSPEMNSYAPEFDATGKLLYFLSDRDFQPRYVAANHFFTSEKSTRVSVLALAAGTATPFVEKNDEEGAADTSAAKDEAKAKARPAKKDDDAAPATRVDVDGLAGRIADVPVPTDHYQRVVPAGDRLLLLNLEDTGEHDPMDAVRQLRAFDLKKQEVTVLVDKLTDFALSADGKKLLLQIEKEFHVVDADVDPDGAKKGVVPTEAWTLTVDPPAEWRQMFHETWRIARDFFYDPNMHGVDWNAVLAKYQRVLPAVADRSDLEYLQGQVVAELNTGHAYIGAGDAPAGRRVPMGFLGADFSPVDGPTPAYRVDKLYAGDGFDYEGSSPLVEPGVDVQVGDYILAVGDQPVRADRDLQALLVGTAGRVIRLTVNRRPSLDGARQVRVKPLPGERWVRYYDWVRSRVDYVRQHGGERLGYVHTPNMDTRGMAEFMKHYYPQSLEMDGMIYDVRHNTGGYIDAMLLSHIATRPYSWFKPRYGASWTRQDFGAMGHAVALIDEDCYSDGEEFCDAFQRLKLGPVVGVPSWGGEVGSGGGYPLLDGGAVYIPNYAEWVPEGQWVIEGSGVKPDIVVEQDPAAELAGRDPQLDRAIAYLKEKLAAEPIVRPTPPPFPNKAH